MERCPDCGTAVDGDACPDCGADLRAPTSETEFEGGDHLSRRAMLTYTGGSAAATLGLIGAGWFTFFYERTGPEEDVVREYVTALDRAHFNRAALLYHEDAPGEAPTPADQPGLRDIDISVEETAVTARESDVSLDAVEELAFVDATVVFESASGTERVETGFVVAHHSNGEWFLWRDPTEL